LRPGRHPHGAKTQKTPAPGALVRGFPVSVRHAWYEMNRIEGVNRGETRFVSSRDG